MASTETLPDGQAKAPIVQESDVPVSVPNDVITATPRENMIETAMRFLQNPQVRTSPLAQKKAFLQKKGLTAEEIEMAIDRSGTRQDVPARVPAPVQGPSGQASAPPQGVQMQQQVVPYSQPVPSRFSSWRDYAAIAIIVGGVGYGIYKLVQNFLMPFLKSRQEERERLEKLEASIQELNESVLQTVQKLETAVTSIQGLLEQQQGKLDSLTASVVTNKAVASHSRTDEITEVKAEITSLKGLLLNRHQFPATPQPSPIPAWQRQSTAPDKTPTKPRDDQSPPAANPQKSEANMAAGDAQKAPEVGVVNGDLADVNHSEGLVNGDESLDVNIDENVVEGESLQGIVNPALVVQAT